MIAKRVTPPNQHGLDLNLPTKKTRKREFFDEMDRVVPWSALVQIVAPAGQDWGPAFCDRDDAAP